MSIAATPALVRPFCYDKSFKVDVQLGEPLLCPSHSENAIQLDLIALCAELDLLCQKELAEHPQHKIEEGNVSRSFKHKTTVIMDQMEYFLRCLPLSSPCQKLLSKDSYLLCLYPRAAAVIANQDGFSMANSECDMDAYFPQMATLNQIHILASQIQDDLRSHNITHLAHKVSLLFQSMNNIGNNSVFIEVKKSIEDNFHVLKTNSKSDSIDLQPQVKQWLDSLLSTVIESTLSLPPEITNCVLEPALLFADS